VIEGKLLERDVVVSKKDPKVNGRLLALVFASSDLGVLKGNLIGGFIENARPIAVAVSTHYIQGHYNSTIGQLVADAKKKLPEEQCRDFHLDPAVVGVFRKPHGLKIYGSTAQQDLEFNRLCSAYNAVKTYCHKERIHFTGTFSPNTFNRKTTAK
jgi:hypothetical protein